MDNNHYIEEKPWGSYEILSEFKVDEPGFRDSCVKILRLKPGSSLSYQSHKHRNEYWLVVQGKGKLTLNDKEMPVQVGSFIEVKIGEKHRVRNVGDYELVIVEIQTGHYDESDIERFEDDYGPRPEPGYKGKFSS